MWRRNGKGGRIGSDQRRERGRRKGKRGGDVEEEGERRRWRGEEERDWERLLFGDLCGVIQDYAAIINVGFGLWAFGLGHVGLFLDTVGYVICLRFLRFIVITIVVVGRFS